MTGPGAEMPFLEHLEELRVRLVRVLLALVAGFGAGLYIVQRFEVVNLLKAPIAPFLKVTGGKLVATSPTEPVMITLKLALVLGLILASPVLIYQIWGFFSPALYSKEKKVVVPALLFGLLLFCAGAAFAFIYLLPQSLPILLGFQTEGIEILITFDNYFSFVVQLVVAMGICFEIPLIMIMMGALGILSPATLNRFRRFAVVLAAIAGAVLSPGTDVLSMIMMMVPILILYEIGFVGVWLVTRRRKQAVTATIILLAALAGSAGRAEAQVPNRPIPRDSVRRVAADSARADSLRRPTQAVDTNAAKRLGLPTAPRYEFLPDDSVITELMARQGYQSTRFRSDSAVIFAQDRHLVLVDKAMTRRGTSTLEGDSISYVESNCMIESRGAPALFDKEQVLAGFGGIRYNTCLRRGIVTDALTSFKQDGKDWFLKGNLAQDSSSARLFASKGEITSCDLPTPHYHFSAREVKWISQTVMVARPAVLYIRDVPILWLPFVFQDARPGRRSGILVPRFGLNDIVRQNPGYNRQITNIGYYWAPNDYFDMVAKLDWYSNRLVSYGASAQYRILSRDMYGGFGYNRQVENTGQRATVLQWSHKQNFDNSTSLNLAINYSTSSRVLQRNSTDPDLSTQQITSSANFNKRYSWGSVAIGGNRRQSITDKSVSTQFPSLSITPKPLDLGKNITWSPGFSLTNSLESNFAGTPVPLAATGLTDSLKPLIDRRNTNINFDTPLRFGGFTWRNSFAYNDRKVDGRQVLSSQRVPDETTPDPTDSITVAEVTTGDFSSDLDWQTGINLPPLFNSSWKLQPSVNIVNSTSGAFFLRNRATGGDWVRQGKRLNFAISSSPTFFGFFPGFGPIARIRHSIQPTVSYSFSPAAAIPEDYARALAGPNGKPVLRSIQSQLISFGLSQNFEAKARPRPGDTTSAENGRKFRLLGIQTTAIQYDFERAKQPGKTGWLTDNVQNTFQSELLPSFRITTGHDLFRGPVGTDSAKFDPFLSNLSAGFAFNGRTIRSLLGIFGLGHGPDTTASRSQEPQGDQIELRQNRFARRRNSLYGYDGDNAINNGGGRAFNTTIDFSISRTRREAGQNRTIPQKNVRLQADFSPTAFWSVSYSTQYDLTDHRFVSHNLNLERVLHEWRARFSFSREPAGNFAFIFSVYLSDLQDIKFDYNQSSIGRR